MHQEVTYLTLTLYQSALSATNAFAPTARFRQHVYPVGNMSATAVMQSTRTIMLTKRPSTNRAVASLNQTKVTMIVTMTIPSITLYPTRRTEEVTTSSTLFCTQLVMMLVRKRLMNDSRTISSSRFTLILLVLTFTYSLVSLFTVTSSFFVFDYGGGRALIIFFFNNGGGRALIIFAFNNGGGRTLVFLLFVFLLLTVAVYPLFLTTAEARHLNSYISCLY